jgi:hypothetical protein
MLELAADLRFLDEAGEDVAARGVLVLEHLHRDVAAEVQVAPLVDDADAAAADLAEQLVAAGGIAESFRGVGHPDRCVARLVGVGEVDTEAGAGARLQLLQHARGRGARPGAARAERGLQCFPHRIGRIGRIGGLGRGAGIVRFHRAPIPVPAAFPRGIP